VLEKVLEAQIRQLLGWDVVGLHSSRRGLHSSVSVDQLLYVCRTSAPTWGRLFLAGCFCRVLFGSTPACFVTKIDKVLGVFAVPSMWPALLLLLRWAAHTLGSVL
jgi:hypothetical protein